MRRLNDENPNLFPMSGATIVDGDIHLSWYIFWASDELLYGHFQESEYFEIES